MSADELRTLIDNLAQDISFEYKGIMGSICPFSRTDISVTFGDYERTFDSVDAVMAAEFFGDPLEEICEEIEFE